MSTLLHIATIILALMCFGGFAWAISRYFSSSGKMPAGMKLVSLLGAVFSVLHLSLIVLGGRSNPYGEMAGLALYLISLTLFYWALKSNKPGKLKLAYTRGSSRFVSQAGPYRFLRHPFYTSYTLAWVAGVFASGFPWLILTVLIMFSLYWIAANREENDFLKSALAKKYKAYQKKTGKFFPRFV